ncbi:unnamed protein product [Periconia digitata]|uniref:Zn(2)-C6 fungal-type domain-containing protein n=1 Tax=Periconia digitata TaxID=1303443 RepID=A0A9W4U630_9PLEO|nr:unnamed protein product [Periconia digitata]
MVSGVSTRSRKQRVAAACDFCRRRKLGCDNKKPKCTKCIVHSRECTYAERFSERPSNSRIAHLLEENKNLRAAIDTQKARSIDTTTTVRTDTLNDAPSRAATAARSTTAIDAIGANFHGPSSVLHDQTAAAWSSSVNPTKVRNTNVRSALFAEAARQRQLERINLKARKLQFENISSERGYELLQVFWNRQHHLGTVVYRPAFMRDMANSGPYFSPVLLFAIMFAGMKYPSSQFSDHATPDSISGMTFRRKAEDMLHHANSDTRLLNKSSITTIQALLLIADTLFSWCDERSLSSHYLGIAISMIIDLGVHTERSVFYRKGSAEDQEIGRRVFWSAYIADKVQSIYQGRPPRLRDVDCIVSTDFLDDYEELEPFHSLTYSIVPMQLSTPTRSRSTFEQLCKLCIVAESIITTLYAEKSFQTDPSILLQRSLALQTNLEEWRIALPPHLNLQGEGPESFDILPHTLSLMSMYHALVILLFRPFVSDGHLHALDSTKASSAFTACANAAIEIDSILKLYKTHFCLKTCPYFISYATYASGTIHARIAAQETAAQEPGGSQFQKMLWSCFETLSNHQEICHAPRQSMKILLALANRLGVDAGSFTAIPSRTDGCLDGQMPMSSSSALDPPSNITSPTYANETIDFDESLNALDMDAIIMSFSQPPRHFGIEHGGTIPACNPPSGAENDGRNSLEYSEIVTDQDNWFLDPLFGLELQH